MLLRPVHARAATASIFFLNGVSVAAWVVRIPDVQRALGLSAGALGVALLGAAAGALVAMPLAGRLVGRIGSHRVTRAAALLYSLTLALPAVAPSLGLLLLALMVNGAANGSLNVSMNAQASEVERVMGRPIMASFHALFSGGGLAGAALGGVIAGWGVSAPLHLAATGGVMLALTLAVAPRLLPDTHSVTVAPAQAASAAGDAPSAIRARLAVLGLLAFAVLVAEGAMADWSAVYLRDEAGASAGVAAVGYAAFSVMMAVGRVVGDALTLRLGARRLVGWGGAVAAAGITLALASPTTLAIAIGFGAVGSGLATAFPSVLTAASRVPGMRPGDGIAAVATLGYFGLLAGPPLIGVVAQLTSLRGGVAVVGGACALTAFLARSLEGERGPDPAGGHTVAGSAARHDVPDASVVASHHADT